MKKTERGKQIQKSNRSLIFICALVLSFVLSTGGSYLLMRDKFAFESPFVKESEIERVKDIRIDKDNDLDRLYSAKEERSSARGGMVFRKDTLLVVAEDFIRRHVSTYKVRLLDLYLDKNGVVYIDFGSEIIKNFSGDVSEEVSLIGGLYNGLKETIPGLSAIKILIGSKERETLGGHINISKPVGEEIARSIM